VSDAVAGWDVKRPSTRTAAAVVAFKVFEVMEVFLAMLSGVSGRWSMKRLPVTGERAWLQGFRDGEHAASFADGRTTPGPPAAVRLPVVVYC
jgi:hypothetical protein